MIGSDCDARAARRWPRGLAVGTVVAACALAASVTAAAAQGEGPRFEPPTVEVHAGPGVVPAPTPATQPSLVASPAVSSDVRESLTVSIVGGDIEISPRTATVTLVAGNDGVLRGTLDDVRVVDARGTLTGWRVVASTDGVLTTPSGTRVDAHKVFVRDASVAPMDGQAAGLQAWPRKRIDRHGAEIAGATRRHGGGTYGVEIELEVDVTPPKKQAAPSTATVVLDLSLDTH